MTIEETTGDWTAILPCTTREEKTEEEMNGRTPHLVLPEKKEEMRFVEWKKG